MDQLSFSRLVLIAMFAFVAVPSAVAATIRVPQQQATLQAAIAAAREGDTILVAPGRYREHVTLKTGVTLRSEGDDEQGEKGLKRAEATVIDGGGRPGNVPGVVMAERSTLDGFTVTQVGVYDETVWQRHYDSQGEELGDEEGSVQAEGTTPAIRILGVTCVVRHCIVHHNGDVGIGILGQEAATTRPIIANNVVFRNLGGGIGVADGATPLIQGNLCYENLRAGIGCRNAHPTIVENICERNIRAGIGCREGARPIIRGNYCRQNRRAGIGIRMAGTSPLVEGNECEENAMAGIGCRDEATPVIRDNMCRKNKMAGIGCRDGARPLIVGNTCRENEMAGIGLQGKASAVIQRNQCIENKLVAIGVTAGSTATILDNDLSRTGGQPPLLAVKDDSLAVISDNRFAGGGVAAILVQGQATIQRNQFQGAGGKQGNAIWIWDHSTASIDANTFAGYRANVQAGKAALVVGEHPETPANESRDKPTPETKKP